MITWEKVPKNDGGDRYNEYRATVAGIEFYVWHSSDAGFGLTAYRGSERLHSSHGIEWRRSLKNCKARAEQILRLRHTERSTT